MRKHKRGSKITKNKQKAEKEENRANQLVTQFHGFLWHFNRNEQSCLGLVRFVAPNGSKTIQEAVPSTMKQHRRP